MLVLAILACLCWAHSRHRRSRDMPVHTEPKPFHIFHHDSSYRHSSRASGTTLPDAYLSTAGAYRTPSKQDRASSAAHSGGNGSGSSGGVPRSHGRTRMPLDSHIPALLPSGSTAPPTGSPVGPAAAAEGAVPRGSRAMHGSSSGLHVPLLDTSPSSAMNSGSAQFGTGVRTMKDAVGQAIRQMEGALTGGGDGSAEAQLRVHALIGRGGFGTVYRGALPHTSRTHPPMCSIRVRRRTSPGGRTVVSSGMPHTVLCAVLCRGVAGAAGGHQDGHAAARRV